MDEIYKAKAENLHTFLEHGAGLRYDYNKWIVARDPERKRVLVGGLGGMGVGEMWFEERDEYKDYVGYAEAPIRDSWMGMGTQEAWEGIQVNLRAWGEQGKD